MATAESEPKLDFDQYKDQLTDEEKKGSIGKMFSYITTVVSSGFSLSQVHDSIVAIENMKSYVGKFEALLENLIKDSKPKEDIIKEAQDFHAKNCTGLNGNFDFGPLIQLTALDTDEETCVLMEKMKTLLEDFKEKQQRASDDVIIKMGKADGIAATVQFVKLYFAWKAISAASNVLEDNKDKFKLINKKMQKMESMVTELVEICETQPEDKSIGRKMAKINSLFTSTISKISDIRVKINGHIQRIELVSDYAAVDIVSNTLTAASRGYQLWNVFESLSLPTKWLGAMTVAMFGFFGVCNAAVFVMSQDKLKELRKDLREANYLKETLVDLHEQAENAIMLL